MTVGQNLESGEPRRWRVSNILAGLLVAASVVLTLAFVGFFVIYRNFSLPSESMIPTLPKGDYLLASRFAYRMGRPQRGDIAVFRLPRDPTIDYVKRIIGMPGETVQMREGRLYINGIIVPREPVARVRAEDINGKMMPAPTYKETLPGGMSDIVVEIQGDGGFEDNTELFKVPADNYFVLGDNRDNSTDSRVSPDQGGVGFVPAANMIARGDYLWGAANGQAEFLKPVH